MSDGKNVNVSVAISGSATTLIVLIIIWCSCAAPYNAMREATLDAIEAKAYAARQSDSAEKARAEAMRYAKRRRAEVAYKRLPFFIKWFAAHPDERLDNSGMTVASEISLAEE